MKRLCPLLLLFCLFPSRGWGQSEDTPFGELILDRLSVSNTDTLYAVKHTHRFSIKPKVSTSFGQYHFKWKEKGKESSFSLRQEPIFKVGMNFSYRTLTLGFQKDVKKLFGNNLYENYEYGASAYGRMIGGDLVYSTSNNYTLEDRNTDSWKYDLDCFRSKRMQANGYFVFNHRRFSYPAAFTQSYRQKRSCGSFLVSLSANYEWLEMDIEGLPKEVAERLEVPKYAKEINYRSLNLGVGYAYNWVVNRHWMLHGSVIPSFSLLKRAVLKYPNHTEKLETDNLNYGCIIRIGVLWDGEKKFGGFTAVMNLNSISRNPADISEFYLRTRLFYGFRF